MDIKFDETQMRELVSKTIFESLTTDGKEELLSKAIQSLLIVEAKDGYYGTKKVNILEGILKDSAERVARQIMEEKLKDNEEFRTQLESVFSDAVKRMFGEETREKLVDKIVESVIKGLNPRDY